MNVNLATALNGVPKEQNERGDGGVLVILLHNGHGDGGDGEGEEGAELRHFEQDVHPQRGGPALLRGQ